ncbi:MAG: Asr1405/Asl0597 family protein [Elainellaceae cyanobacterium]
MNNADIDSAATLDLNPIERWSVFLRLQELSIPCQCGYNRPLRVDVNTAAAVVQVWSVVQRLVKSRNDLTAHLEQCWKQPVQL